MTDRADFLTLDIETVPQARFVDPSAFAYLDEDYLREVGHDADVLRFEIEEGQAKIAATGCAASLHATTCEVVQVSFGWRTGPEVKTRLCQRDGYASEADLLTDALGVIQGATDKRTTLVSFNGKQFDIPILRARAALLGLARFRIPWRRLLYPFADDQHADLRLVLGADDRRARGTLQWWSEAFGVHAEEHGGQVWRWARDGRWDLLRSYGEVEAKTLVELFEAVRAVL